jgi:CHAP domain-containing protein
MRTLGTGTKAYLLGSALLFTSPAFTTAAQSNQTHGRPAGASNHVHQVNTRIATTYHAGARQVLYSQTHAVAAHGYGHGHAGRRPAVRYAGISCVPYARQVSGIMVAGNAWQWWDNAAGEYARGERPEVGSVLNFRSNPRMPLGHVAVVTRVVNPREVIIEQANWGSTGMRGRISRDVAVVDVSEANNWSAVRVELGRRGEFGAVYPTYGFIYNRPDNGLMTAGIRPPAPQRQINPAPTDLRPLAERPWHTYEEVAESTNGARRRIDLKTTQIASGR